MRRAGLWAVALVAVLALGWMFWGCSSSGDDDTGGDTADDDTTDDDTDDDTQEGTATIVECYIKPPNNCWVDMATMEPADTEVEGYDFKVGHCAPKNPCIFLHPDCGAINLGNEQDFHEVDEAPESGYQYDSGDDLVIGDTFWTERLNGEFEMSENIYVLKMADNTYGKIEVLSAKRGTVRILCYRQPEEGNRDISTTE